MSLARALRTASRSELRARIVNGHPVDPGALEGFVYRGTSLGLPTFAERFTWKTFQKTFYRDPPSGRLLGWNVRLHQDGIDAKSRPIIGRDGNPVTTWHYEVLSPDDEGAPPRPKGFDRGLFIDYARGENPSLEPVRLGRDPLVSLSPDHADELLGVTYLTAFGATLETPTYFTLEREGPIEFVPYEVPAAPVRRSPTRLWPFERAWAEALFSAVLPMDPPFSAIDRTHFWRCLEEAPADTFGVGLRGMVHALTFMPLTRGQGPFFTLDEEEQERFLDSIAKDERYVVRQMIVTMKTLACMAYYDDPTVRARIA